MEPIGLRTQDIELADLLSHPPDSFAKNPDSRRFSVWTHTCNEKRKAEPYLHPLSCVLQVMQKLRAVSPSFTHTLTFWASQAGLHSFLHLNNQVSCYINQIEPRKGIFFQKFLDENITQRVAFWLLSPGIRKCIQNLCLRLWNTI